MAGKPFAESCEQNRAPILAVIEPWLREAGQVLEIGSGTGQHAVYFASAMPHLRWQTSDRAALHPGIQAWIDESGNRNLAPPLALDVCHDRWPGEVYDAAFSANTAHIMDRQAVEAMFAGLGRVLAAGAPFLLYGPFNRNGGYTSESNRRFDQWLKARDPRSGIKDIGWLNELAGRAGMEAAAEYPMPANNLILVWRAR